MSDEQNTANAAVMDKPDELDRRCTLVVPGLLDLPTAERESAFAQVGRLAELEWFFSHAQAQAFSSKAFDAVLFDLFGELAPRDEDLPVAPVSYLADAGKLSSAWCLRADPVQLIPDRDQLVLMALDDESLTQAEANQLVAELNAQFVLDGWRIEACTPTRWYLHHNDLASVRTHPLAQVHAKAIGEFLPTGKEGTQWHRLMNEIQMVLHGSVVNQQRQAAGQAMVSSVWFWGGGETPSLSHSHWSQVWSNEPVSLGLAELTNTPRRELPENAISWMELAISPGEHLIVLDELSDVWRRGDMSVWTQQVRRLNREWIAPLLKALRKNNISELSLCSCDGRKFNLTRLGLRRWWRRKKSLAAIAAQS